MNNKSFLRQKRLSICHAQLDDHQQDELSHNSLPTSPSYINSQVSNLSSSLKNGPHSSTGSVTSSKSHSPASSLTNTMTTSTKHDDSNISHSGPTTSERDKKVRNLLLVLIHL